MTGPGGGGDMGADAELTQVFRDEAASHLDEMDAALMAAESGEGGAGAVDGLFRAAHTIKGAAGMLGFDDIRALAHAMEDVFGAIRAAGDFPAELAAPLLRATSALRAHVAGGGEPIDTLLDELASARAALAGSGAAAPSPAAEPPPAEPRAAEPPPAEPRAAEPPPAEPRAAEPPPAEPPAPEPPPAEPPPARPAPSPPAAQPAGDPQRTLRVPAAKIDQLLDVVGEVMQDRRRLGHALAADPQLPAGAADALTAGDRMLGELKDTAVAMRTLPLASIAGPLPRAVRDMARDAGREVEFVITGGDTELDRVILESLSELLVHLLRNAIGHGIEPPAERARAGKPRRGRIELRAVPRGSQVELVVTDDGRGISPGTAAEAQRQGSLTDVLTRPGYTTAAEVTDVTGRGVGLDAVKAYVQSLGGSIEARSGPGHGMTVSLLLPLALALLEVLLFERGSAVFGVPLAAVGEVVLVSDTLMLEGRPALEIGGRALPVADTAAVLGMEAPPLRAASPALVVSGGGRRAVVTCDAITGQLEVVVKPLGPLLAGVPGYLGAAILGDGRIALLAEPGLLTGGRGRPAAEPAAAAPPAAAPARPEPTVLVVEDSFTVRELQRSILEAAGYPVVTARDGRDALQVLGRHPETALVITDLEMPELDGLGLTRAIRADPARASLPVVVVTSHGTDEDRRQGIEAGADAYMVKRDFDQQALLATVERLAGR